MAESKKKKVESLLKSLNRKFGKVTRPEFLPPPSSADAAAAMAVAKKNSEIIAGGVLGLHGPPHEGQEAARRLMNICVDWNETRVANAPTLIRALGRDPRAEERIAVLQRFLEAFFLRQRNLHLDVLVNMRPAERRQFLSNLEVFDREELAAVLLTCFGHPVFPPAEAILQISKEQGLVPERTTKLQMAKKFETMLDEESVLALYSHLYALAQQLAAAKAAKSSRASRRRPKVSRA